MHRNHSLDKLHCPTGCAALFYCAACCRLPVAVCFMCVECHRLNTATLDACMSGCVASKPGHYTGKGQVQGNPLLLARKVTELSTLSGRRRGRRMRRSGLRPFKTLLKFSYSVANLYFKICAIITTTTASRVSVAGATTMVCSGV